MEPSISEAESELLDGIYRIAYGPNEIEYDQSGEPSGELLEDDAEYPLCLAYSALIVRTLASQLDPSLFVSAVPERVLFTGFDSGDWICVGAVSEEGLRLSEDGEAPP